MTEYDCDIFAWRNIVLSETVDIDGVPYITCSAVGEWLEYTEPEKAITNLLERNPHIERYAKVVRLTTVDGKTRKVFVYHPIGFLLLVMESGQPRAQSMNVDVTEFVWHFAGPRYLGLKKEQVVMKLQRILLLNLARTTDLMQCLVSKCESAQFSLIGYEINELLGRVEIALAALEKKEKKIPAPHLEKDAGTTVPRYLSKQACSTSVKMDESLLEIPVEHRATLKVSIEFARMLAKIVREAGYSCDSISSARPLNSGDGYQLACNRFALGYCVSGKKGNWSVSPD